MATQKHTKIAGPPRADRLTITMPAKVRRIARAQAAAWRPDERPSVSAWLCELVRRAQTSTFLAIPLEKP